MAKRRQGRKCGGTGSQTVVVTTETGIRVGPAITAELNSFRLLRGLRLRVSQPDKEDYFMETPAAWSRDAGRTWRYVALDEFHFLPPVFVPHNALIRVIVEEAENFSGGRVYCDLVNPAALMSNHNA